MVSKKWTEIINLIELFFIFIEKTFYKGEDCFMDSNLINIKMTAQQVAEGFGYSLSSIKTKFKRTQQSIKKKYGVQLVKCQGLQGTYYIISDQRAKTMFDQVKCELYVPIETLKMDTLACFVVLGVAATPQGVFRGTKKDFLDYIGLSHSTKNIELLGEVLNTFANVEGSPLICKEDKDYIIIYIERQFEKQRIVTIKMLRACKQIVQRNNKQTLKIIQLWKVWEAYRINQQNGVKILTNKDLQKYIDLSSKQIRDIRKLLQKQDLININRAGNAIQCYGQNYATAAYY